jgi:hypothetical protein
MLNPGSAPGTGIVPFDVSGIDRLLPGIESPYFKKLSRVVRSENDCCRPYLDKVFFYSGFLPE